jgi:DNA-directed RNA polymerase
MAGKKLTISDRMSLGPFLTLLKPHQLALLTIMEVLRLHGTGGVSEGMKTARALITVGMAVEQEYNAAMRKREMSRRHNLEKFYRASSHEPSSSLVKASDGATLPSHPETRGGLDSINARREAAKRDAEVEAASAPEWSRAIQARIGGILVDALMDTATVMRTIPHPETGEP